MTTENLIELGNDNQIMSTWIELGNFFSINKQSFETDKIESIKLEKAGGTNYIIVTYKQE